MTDEELDEIEDGLRPRLTDEFLATLVEAAKVNGNGGDWPATEDFVRETFRVAGKEPPDFEPYDTQS